MPKININDINIYYELHGEGKPLVCIMGQGGTVKHFKSSILFSEFRKYMFKEFKTLLYDNRGIGQTDDIDKQYSIKTLADDITRLIDRLNLGKVNLLGFSMGGMITQELMINYPEKIEKAVIGSTHCGRPKSIMPSKEIFSGPPPFQEGVIPEDRIKYQIPLVYTKDFIKNNPDIIETLIQNYISRPIPLKVYQKQINAVLRFKSYKKLPLVQIPTLILHGKDDLLVPPQNAEILFNLLPRAKLKIFENCGHAILIEQTEAVMNAILEFLV